MKKPARYGLMVLAFAVSAQCAAQANASAQYFPLVFSAEGTPLRTGACISASFRTTETETWWRPGVLVAGPGPADAALVGVLGAIKRQDQAALLELSHRSHGRDPKRFNEQARALFAQFPALGAPTVQYAVAFDEFTVYYLRFGASGKPTLAPFIFELDADGAWRYLPYRTGALTYELLQEWIRSPFGPGNGAPPLLCTKAEVAKLQYAIPLGAAARAGGIQSRLLLNLEMPPASPRARSVANVFTGMQKALADGNEQLYAAGLAPEGRRRFLEWHAAAAEGEKTALRLSMDGLRPLAMLDFSPVAALVVRGLNQRTEVAYFLTAGETPLMVNSSHITTVDRVFKREEGPVKLFFKADKPPTAQWGRER